MAYIGGGTGKVTFEMQNQPAQNQAYSLQVSEMGPSLSLMFIPILGNNSTPIVQIAIADYQPGTQQYTSNQIGKGITVLVTAAFEYPHGPEYISGLGSSGEIELSWTISGTDRSYTGYFWAYNMPLMGKGPPMSLKFVKFSFTTSDTVSTAFSR